MYSDKSLQNISIIPIGLCHDQCEIYEVLRMLTLYGILESEDSQRPLQPKNSCYSENSDVN